MEQWVKRKVKTPGKSLGRCLRAAVHLPENLKRLGQPGDKAVHKQSVWGPQLNSYYTLGDC